MNEWTWGLLHTNESLLKKRIANFCIKRIYRRGETKQVLVSEFTPGNGVNSDTLKIPIEILLENFYDFCNFNIWRLVLIFLYETDLEITKLCMLKAFRNIALLFRLSLNFPTFQVNDVTLRLW